MKTTEEVTQELNKLLEENNKSLRVHAILETNGVTFVVKVMEKPEPATEDAGQ